jgi:hypothetical protein
MHTARIWMALAIPGGAPGYDGNKEFGNFITHMAARTSQRLRGYSRPTPEVKGGGAWRDFGRLTGFRAFGEGEFGGFSYARAVSVARMSEATSGKVDEGVPGCCFAHPGYEAAVFRPGHPLAAFSFTHSNSGNWCRNQVNCRLA